MGKMILFARPDGAEAPGYLSEPSEGEDAPGVVVLQEWWGLNEQIQHTADRLAKAGFRALVPDLYRGRRTTKPDEAHHLAGELDWMDATQQDVAGAAACLRRPGQITAAELPVAVIGFCMGGALAVAAGVHVKGLHAGVVFYGLPQASLADPARLSIPMLFHYAEHDDWCTPEQVRQLELSLDKAGVHFELNRYDAAHGFFNETRKDVYDPEAAEEAWEITTVFLDRTLRPH